MFTENDLYDFEEFTSIVKQGLLELRRKKGNTMAAFNDQKITLIHDVILYYQFLGNSNNEVLVEDPT